MQTYPEEILSRVLVPIGGSSRQHYELLHLPFNKEDREVTVNLVLVAQITELKLLVAVPEAAWSRTVGERPKGSGIEKNQYFPMFKYQSFWVSISCFQGPFNIDMKY